MKTLLDIRFDPESKLKGKDGTASPESSEIIVTTESPMHSDDDKPVIPEVLDKSHGRDTLVSSQI